MYNCWRTGRRRPRSYPVTVTCLVRIPGPTGTIALPASETTGAFFQRTSESACSAASRANRNPSGCDTSTLSAEKYRPLVPVTTLLAPRSLMRTTY